MALTQLKGTQIKDADVSLTVDVTGTLPVANGGTGAATLTAGLVYSAGGTAALTTVSAPSGSVVGTTDTQTLTNKTLTGPTITATTGFSGPGGSITGLNGSNISSGTVPAARGGAGTVNGILKANGSGTVSAATAGTDYLTPTGSGTGLSGVALLGSANTHTAGHNQFTATASIGGAQINSGRLSIHQAASYNSETGQAIYIQSGASDSALLMGADATNDIGYIQSMQAGTSWSNRPLVLQGMGGGVSIGTLTTKAPLTINGGGAFGGSVPAISGMMCSGRMMRVSGNDTFYLDINAGPYAEFSTYNYSSGATFPMVMQANGGNLLIGTTTDPGDKLRVNGACNANSYKVNGTAGATGSFTTVDGKTVTVTAGIITSIV